MVVPTFTEFLCGLDHSRPGHAKGPAGLSRGALLRQHRRQGSAGAWERRRGVAPLVSCAGVAAPAHMGRTGGLDLWRCGSASNAVVCGGTWGLSTHRAGSTGPTQPFDPGLCIFAFSAGRPRASPEPTVLLGDRAAVPCRPVTTLERGPTTYGTTRTSHRSSKPRVVLSGPPLAGTDTSTNEAVRVAVTRRTGERGAELRCDRGTVREASWRGTCRACRGPRCSGRGSPSRGTGSRAARRR